MQKSDLQLQNSGRYSGTGSGQHPAEFAFVFPQN
jgi:hypothetical protein